MLAHGNEVQAPVGIAVEEKGRYDKHIEQIGQDIPVEEGLSNHRDRGQAGNGQGGQSLHLLIALSAGYQLIQEAGHAQHQHIQCQAAHRLVLGQADGKQTMEKAYHHTAQHAAQKAHGNAVEIPGAGKGEEGTGEHHALHADVQNAGPLCDHLAQTAIHQRHGPGAPLRIRTQ